ncbi:methyltransferase domain-containing protein [Sphaerotilaceae bacterium SBD11-9]
MSTDIAWELWGARDPYFGVLTDPKFRRGELTPQAKEEFFHSGRAQVQHVLQACRTHLDPAFDPQRVLDFGCGVGRVLIPFAEISKEALGLDISPSMLAEAGANCRDRGVTNALLALSDDTLSAAPGQFDLVHSCIVLQHIEVTRGRTLFAHLVEKVRPGGCGAIQVTFGWDVHAATFGWPPSVVSPAQPSAVQSLWRGAKSRIRRVLEALGLMSPPPPPPEPAPLSNDPEMQMNFYNFSELMFILQHAGIHRFHSEFTDHGGALGAFVYFQKPANTG